MDRNRWIVFGIICIALFGVLVLNKKSDSVNVDSIDPSKIITDSKGINDHVLGDKKSKVVLIEYGDFQCPGCGGLYPNLHPLTQYYKQNMAFVFRNFPLTSLHPNALAAASAAESAGIQGKFWEYHNMLYENQNAWSAQTADKRTATFKKYAQRLELNTTTFEKDITNKKVSEKIDLDGALGRKIGADSTPTLVLNGKKLVQNQWSTAQQLEDTLRTAIKDSGQALPEKLNK